MEGKRRGYRPGREGEGRPSAEGRDEHENGAETQRRHDQRRAVRVIDRAFSLM